MNDAHGNNLQKNFTPPTGTAVPTSYINEFVYQGDVLQYINFEEGRIRAVTAVSTNNGFDGLTIDGNMDLPNDTRGAYDYFIRDYQQNVRMILTEEVHTGINQCTMELSRAANEEPIFGQAGANNEVAQTRFTPKPAGWTSNTTSYVSKLGSLTKKAGPNVLLKVMAGDQLTASTKYYYQNAVTNGTGDNLTTSIVTALIQSILGSPATGLAKGNTTPISTQLNADAVFKTKTAPDANNATGTNPKAYMTIVFFDERFNYVAENSMALRVAQIGDNAAPLVLANIKAPKNGFAYVYLSNESLEPVYFDDFTVSDTRGRIIEEDHYYAYGLKIAGISSVKLGDLNEGLLDNKNLYNDKELFEEADLDWYDYGYRNYDPQIGRFPQLDPLTDDYPHYTPYQYAGNEPIANVDLDGLEEIPSLAPVIIYKSLPKAASTGGSLALKLTTRLALATAKGVSDAIVNANTLGVSDGLFGTNRLNSYGTDAEKAAYLRGRIGGDAIALAQSTTEMNVGEGIALSTGAQTFGAGAGAGLVVGLHGAGVGATAASDAAWATKKLYELNRVLSSATSAGESAGNIEYTQPSDTKAPWSNDAEKIGGGHAWSKHKGEFPGVKSQSQFKKLVDKVMTGKSNLYRKLSNGREAWYDTTTKTLVIKDPNSPDLGTMFKAGIKYFNNLK